MIVTIDGPVASGKSTISRMLADRLGFYYVCSGFLYRSVAYVLVTQHGYTSENLVRVTSKDLAQCIDPARLRYEYDATLHERVFFDDRDITPYLKDKFMDEVTSVVSVNKDVRHAVTAMQRVIASEYSIVIDGRDVGSVVFPQAQVKFFLTASVEVRAERWRKDQERYDNHFTIDEAIALITERDERDKIRTIAPLIVPHNAVIIDSSVLTIEQTMEKMMKIIKDYLPYEL